MGHLHKTSKGESSIFFGFFHAEINLIDKPKPGPVEKWKMDAPVNALHKSWWGSDWGHHWWRYPARCRSPQPWVTMGHGSVARRPSADSKVRCWKIPKNLPANIGVHGILHVKKCSRVWNYMNIDVAGWWNQHWNHHSNSVGTALSPFKFTCRGVDERKMFMEWAYLLQQQT